MECGEVQERLSCYLDGILDEATLESVESHLAVCADCRTELDALRALTHAAGQIDDVEPPAHLKAAIIEAVGEVQKDPVCGEILLLMSDYIDGELAESKAALVKRHITACKSCAYELDMLARTVFAVTSIGEVDPPVSLRDRIAAATAGRKVSGLSTLGQRLADGLWPKKLGWAAAAMVAAAAFFTFVSVNAPRVRTHPNAAVRRTPAPVVKPAPKPVPVKTASAVPGRALAESVAHRESGRSESAEEPRIVNAAPVERPARLRALVQPVVAVRKPKGPAAPPEVDGQKLVPAVDTAEPPADTEPGSNTPTAPAQPARVVAQLPSPFTEDAKREEPQPSLMKITVAPTGQSRDMQGWAQSIKQEVALKRGAGRTSSLTLFGARF